MLQQSAKGIVGRVMHRLGKQDGQAFWIGVAPASYPGRDLWNVVACARSCAIGPSQSDGVIVMVPELVTLLIEQSTYVALRDQKLSGRMMQKDHVSICAVAPDLFCAHRQWASKLLP
jgi:hypothetical protein